MLFLTKTPQILKKFYPDNLIWNKSRDKKVIYLTFDDGPIPIVTPWVLKTLEKFNVKATFFCIGDNIKKNPEIFDELKLAGHQIGNHTFNHLKGWDTHDELYLENIRSCQNLTKTNLFRPPYGRIKRSQIKKILTQPLVLERSSKEKGLNAANQFQIIMWDVLTGDFDPKRSPEKCLRNTLKHTSNGSIVVFHDSLKAWERLQFVLPRALEKWKNEGFEFAVL